MEEIINRAKYYLVPKGDKILWVMILALMLISLVAVFSSTGKLAYVSMEGDTTRPLFKQAGLFVAALGVMLFVQSMHYKYFISLATPACWLALLLLALALVISLLDNSARVNDTARWIKIPILGSIQPSEVAKLGLVMYMARVLAFEQLSDRCSNRVLFKIALIFLPPWILIFNENASTSVLLALVCAVMLFVGRLHWKPLLLTYAVAAALATVFLVTIMNTDKLDHIARVVTIKERLNNKNPFQANQAKIAIARGGLHGVGPGRSVQRNFLPNPQSDYIYAIIVEEYGLLVGGIPVLLIYAIILYRVGTIARRCTRAFPALLVTGLGITIFLQAIIHVCVCTGVFPVTGQPLPLVSTGGTSILLLGVAFGMIQSVAHTFSDAGQQEERERQARRKAARRREIERLEREEDDETLYFQRLSLNFERPLQTLKCLVQSLKCPLQSLKCPLQSLKCLVQTLKCLVQISRCLVRNLKCPLQSLKCLVQTLKCPLQTLKCLVQTLKCPCTKFEMPFTKFEMPCTNFEMPCTKCEMPCTKFEISPRVARLAAREWPWRLTLLPFNA
ncbi:MAG: FtsW/RodA/SpoVE family cell cycle protein [Odoribacteraceae bacterium]|jgi:cell division protein FtsW|nr:FtsW/RodA/SpoVE family cell cycle protein [Odoribacteraceae bacterium]